jgi:PhnB protein
MQASAQGPCAWRICAVSKDRAGSKSSELQTSLHEWITKEKLTMAVKAIPDGYHSVTPYLVVEGAEQLIDFLKNTFDGQEAVRMPMAGGTIGHAEIRIGDSVVMLADATSEHPAGQANIMVYVSNADAAYQRALKAGAASLQEPTNQFYGDRSARVRDPLGNQWTIATHVEDVSPDEMTKRLRAMEQAGGHN